VSGRDAGTNTSDSLDRSSVRTGLSTWSFGDRGPKEAAAELGLNYTTSIKKMCRTGISLAWSPTHRTA